jgi:hypothetical protein
VKTQAGQSKLERRQQVLQYLADWGWLSTLSTRKLQSELAKREKKRQRLVEAFPELEGPDPRILMRGLVDFTREGQWAEYDGLQSEIRAFKLELFHRKARRPGRAAQPSNSTHPRAMVKAYIEEVRRTTGKRITKKDIWTKAGYNTRTEFERWERQDSKHPNKAAAEVFPRILCVEKPHLK